MSKRVILSGAKDLTRRALRSFAPLRMTCDDQSRQVVVLEGRLTLTPMGATARVALVGWLAVALISDWWRNWTA